MLFDETQKSCSSSSYFDREIGAQAVKILPGEYFATDADLAITTLLGSCVSVCLFDRTAGVGGMNHFMLPEALRGNTRCDARHRTACGAPCSAKYGACAMRHLLTHLEQLGARCGRLEAKLFGAGRVMGRMTDIGALNAQFALGYLEEHRIPVVAQDLGDNCPRRIVFFPSSGRALVKRLRDIPVEIPL